MSITSQVVMIKNQMDALANNKIYNGKILIDVFLEALYLEFGIENMAGKLDEIFLTEFLCGLSREDREYQTPLCNNDCDNCPCEVVVNKLKLKEEI